MSTDTQHLVYHRSRVSELEHELALARASSDYWRTKYVATSEAATEYVGSIRNARTWYEAALRYRAPMDETNE